MRIAILEDEAPLLDLMKGALDRAGHAISPFPAGRAMLAALKRETFDLLILDWNLPDMAGTDVLAWVRAHLEPGLPVLFVTSRNEEADVVHALDAGADDYLAKPVRLPELLARVGALLRRSYRIRAEERETFGRYVLDRAQGAALLDGEPMPLTPKEYELATLLFRNQDRALSRSYMMEAVWGHDPDLVTRTLDVHVSRLREKLRLRPDHGYKLVPVYSFGYRLERVEAGNTEQG